MKSRIRNKWCSLKKIYNIPWNSKIRSNLMGVLINFIVCAMVVLVDKYF